MANYWVNYWVNFWEIVGNIVHVVLGMYVVALIVILIFLLAILFTLVVLKVLMALDPAMPVEHKDTVLLLTIWFFMITLSVCITRFLSVPKMDHASYCAARKEASASRWYFNFIPKMWDPCRDYN